jgi:hypothetical protein
MEIQPYTLKNLNIMGNSACYATQHKPGVSINRLCLMSLRVCTFRHVECVNVGIFHTTWPPNASTSSGAQVKKQ